jgi:hypothetical protein
MWGLLENDAGQWRGKMWAVAGVCQWPRFAGGGSAGIFCSQHNTGLLKVFLPTGILFAGAGSNKAGLEFTGRARRKHSFDNRTPSQRHFERVAICVK